MVKLCIVAALLVACFAVQIDAEDVETAWENFQAQFPQNTNSQEELTKRYRNFAATHEAIENHRKSNSTFDVEHNRFSVLSNDEIKDYLGANIPVIPAGRYFTIEEPIERQSGAVDYRKDKCMPAVKNQGSCGSCWAFAATAVVEFGKCIKNGGTKVSLSEQQLVDCNKDSFGCSGGWYDKAWKYLSGNSNGQVTAASYPYKAANGTCKTTGVTKGATISSSSPVTYIGVKDVNTMKTILNQKRLFSVIISVVKSFTTYKSGVYNEPNCSTNRLGYHAITVVGYGKLNNDDYWVIRNSWGPNWGAAGYILFKRGSNVCLVETYASTTTVL